MTLACTYIRPCSILTSRHRCALPIKIGCVRLFPEHLSVTFLGTMRQIWLKCP